MARTTVLVLAAVAASAATVWLVTGRDGELAAARAEVARLEQTLAESRATNSELEARLRTLEQAAPAVEAPRVAVDSGAAGSDDSSVADDAPGETQAAHEHVILAHLRQLHPDRFATMTIDELRAITSLELRGTATIDEDLRRIAALPNLTALNLRGTAITDAGLWHLARRTNLKMLELRGTAVTGPGLAALPFGLEHVDLTDTQLGPTGFHTLPTLPNLITLKLNRLPVRDADLEVLVRWPRLHHLEIDGTAVGEQGLRRLLALHPGIARIEARGLSLSEEFQSELRARYPGLDLVTD